MLDMAKMRSRGFSLIELMMVVAIAGILMAIVLPNYQEYKIKAVRSAAKAVLLDVVSRQEQYAVSNRAYALTTGDLGITLPDDVASHYTINITPQSWVSGTVTMSGFTAQATPVAGSPQVADGALSINQFGLKTPPEKW